MHKATYHSKLTIVIGGSILRLLHIIVQDATARSLQPELDQQLQYMLSSSWSYKARIHLTIRVLSTHTWRSLGYIGTTLCCISAIRLGLSHRRLWLNCWFVTYNTLELFTVKSHFSTVIMCNCHILYSVRQKKVSPKVFCHFLSNCSEFLHEISHVYYSFIIT